jgi:hypothetical protein
LSTINGLILGHIPKSSSYEEVENPKRTKTNKIESIKKIFGQKSKKGRGARWRIIDIHFF